MFQIDLPNREDWICEGRLRGCTWPLARAMDILEKHETEPLAEKVVKLMRKIVK
jgi:hypothetical protein